MNDNQLIKHTNRRLVSIVGFSGICHICNSPQTYSGELIVIEIGETEDKYQVICKDMLECPHCGAIMQVMEMYKTLEVTKEFEVTPHETG